MNASDLITLDPDILGGTPVFARTRVPVKTLFDYLEDDYTRGILGVLSGGDARNGRANARALTG